MFLRALEMDDLDRIMEHWNIYETRRFLANAIAMSKEHEREWLESATKAMPWRDGNLVLAIEDKFTKQFLGTVSFFDVSRPNRRAEFGIAIHNPENLGRGYGTDATRVMLWVAFHILGLNSVYLHTFSNNKRAQIAYEKAGFKRAGVFRKANFTEGEFHDIILMDILRDEFMERYPPGNGVGTPP